MITVGLYLNIFCTSGLMIDDWGQLLPYKLSFHEHISTYFPDWSNRPVGALILLFLTRIIGENYSLYFVTNYIVYITSLAIISLLIFKCSNFFTAILFFLLAAQPIISDTFTYSPINESTPVFSIFFWTLSLYVQSVRKSKFTNTTIFILLLISLLIYEITLPLFLVNLFLCFPSVVSP